MIKVAEGVGELPQIASRLKINTEAATQVVAETSRQGVSHVAQWQSIRLLIGRLLVRVQPWEHRSPSQRRFDLGVSFSAGAALAGN